MINEFKPFPQVIPLKKILGPSFIILALGLGSGEVILWPYLSSNFGLGIAWAALLGITFQFFINMEIERYALVKGESVFIGIHQIFKWAATWFIVSTFIGFGLPGIIAAAAQIFGSIIGISEFKWLAIILLIIIGLILSSGHKVYDLMERLTKTIIFVGIPFIIILVLIFTTGSDWLELGRGLAGLGDGYNFMPAGISLATFLAAFAYSGAGGNLNLSQSIYIKEKGYGMGQYAQKITGLFHLKKDERVYLSGAAFQLTESNIKNFRAWWKKINLEHLLVFWFIGFLAIAVLMVLSYATTHGLESNLQGIQFVINEGSIIGQRLQPLIGLIFLVVVSVMLFQTQLGVMDSTSRIMAENWALKTKREDGSCTHLSKIYSVFVWAQVAFGVILFLFDVYEPKFLLVLGAVINAVAMFVHIALVNWTNHKLLPKVFRPHIIRKVIIIIIFLFFGVFSAVTIWSSWLSHWLF